jgi:hypothetical protein
MVFAAAAVQVSVRVTVVAGAAARAVLAERPTLLAVGDTVGLGVSVRDAYGNLVPRESVTVTVSDASRLVLVGTDTVVATSVGSVTVRIRSGAFADSVLVWVGRGGILTSFRYSFSVYNYILATSSSSARRLVPFDTADIFPWQAAVSPDGREVAYADRERGAVVVWDLSAAIEALTIPLARNYPMHLDAEAVFLSDWGSPERVRVWDQGTGTLRDLFPDSVQVYWARWFGGYRGVIAADWTAAALGGVRLVGRDGDRLKFFNVAGEYVFGLGASEAAARAVVSVAQSNGSSSAVVAVDTASTVVSRIPIPGVCTQLYPSPDGQLAAVFVRVQLPPNFELWDLYVADFTSGTLTPVESDFVPSEAPLKVAWAPDGSALIVTGHTDRGSGMTAPVALRYEVGPGEVHTLPLLVGSTVIGWR